MDRRARTAPLGPIACIQRRLVDGVRVVELEQNRTSVALVSFEVQAVAGLYEGRIRPEAIAIDLGTHVGSSALKVRNSAS